MSGYISLFASLIHAFKCYAFMPNGLLARPIRSLCNATEISYPSRVRPKYLPVVLVLGFPCPPLGAACRDSPSGLRFVTVPLWWWGMGDPWTFSITSMSCYMLPSSGHPLLVSQSPPSLSSLCISFPTSVLFVTTLSPY